MTHSYALDGYPKKVKRKASLLIQSREFALSSADSVLLGTTNRSINSGFRLLVL